MKYVDDTTIAECVDKKEDSHIQSDVEELIAKSNQNEFQLNESKCKELRISFAKSAANFAPIVINRKEIEVVSTVKLLGLNISSDLWWNCHVAEISKKKVASRLYFLKQLKRANIPAKDLLIFYLNCIRPVMEYACPVFYDAFVSYSDALHEANLETLSRRRQSITTKLFDSITRNSDHKLNELLPPRNNCESNLRRKRNFNVPLAKTKRLKKTFIYSNCN